VIQTVSQNRNAVTGKFTRGNNPGLLAAALGDVAKARGMTDIAKASGLSREALYKALRPNAQPRFDTINRVCRALGVRLVAQPV
jgi:probable addiction module antidote protein